MTGGFPCSILLSQLRLQTNRYPCSRGWCLSHKYICQNKLLTMERRKGGKEVRKGWGRKRDNVWLSILALKHTAKPEKVNRGSGKSSERISYFTHLLEHENIEECRRRGRIYLFSLDYQCVDGWFTEGFRTRPTHRAVFRWEAGTGGALSSEVTYRVSIVPLLLTDKVSGYFMKDLTYTHQTVY